MAANLFLQWKNSDHGIKRKKRGFGRARSQSVDCKSDNFIRYIGSQVQIYCQKSALGKAPELA